MPKTKLTRQEQKEATRQRLVEAALALFAERGILATTTAEVATAVEVSHGTVFLHFPTREDLVIAVIDEFGRRLSAQFARSLQGEPGLRTVLQAHLAVLEEFEDFYARLVTEVSLLPTSVRSTLFSLQSAIANQVFLAAQREMERGRIKKIERHLLFNTWISLLHYYLAHRDVFAKTSVIHEKGDEILAHFLRLIKT